ncbi:Transglycosylase SLT domain-containing protein [Neptunomonas antarctica]|uniref:Transglycosylase SLT domain-containing protein n=2 Tax=Neptunomonas antarctica TaxID=619304 RepID=A0A1N7MPR6_9GAMM|nr:Transglycosylase SLT domain-containing protein [Neptunomonas antarctica]
MASCSAALAAGIPHESNRYRNDLTRQARLIWGIDAPIAVMAAQVHQESAWDKSAVSAVGATGLAQFMPATARWIPVIDSQLSNPQPTNPTWALRALARYDFWLYSRLRADTHCDRWAMTLSAYNGGLGWVLRDKKAANAAGDSRWLWWDNVEKYNAGRKNDSFLENRGYPRRILLMLMPRYQQAGWGQGIQCGGTL